MTQFLKAAALTAASLTAIAAPQVAVAQVAIADVQAAVQRSAAFVAATAQMRTTYATQIAAFDARSKVLQTELQPQITAFNTARAAPNANQTALQTQATAIQQRQQAAQTELQRLSLPIARAQAYVEEQIASRLEAAVTAAMAARRVTVVLQPQAAVKFQPTADITDAVIAELNRTVPTASITPPAGWQPGQQRAPGAATPAPARPTTPPGR